MWDFPDVTKWRSDIGSSGFFTISYYPNAFIPPSNDPNVIGIF
jgi:hypothetical protein